MKAWKHALKSELMEHTSEKITVKTILIDLLTCLLAALCVAGSLYFFSNYNAFAPGGVTGFASIFATLLHAGDISSNMSLFMILLNTPIFILVAIFVSKRTGAMLLVYMCFQSGLMMLFRFLHEKYGLPYYAALPSDPLYEQGNELLFAAIGVGVISGFGFSLMLRRFGASGGTFAISALIKHFHPERSIAWVAFVMDASVVFVSLFAYETGINALIVTLLNIFISDFISDFFLQGGKSGYKFEIVTDDPEALSAELLTILHRGVTAVPAKGMYSGKEKTILVCIVRKRQIGAFLKILKKHGATFSYSAKVNEVYGNFREDPLAK